MPRQSLNKEQSKKTKRTTQSVVAFIKDTTRNPYDTLEKPAKTLKALLQMSIGIFLACSVGAQLYGAMKISHDISSFWTNFDRQKIIDIIVDALLIATAIELGYMLFTDGPDEAINPPIIALAAAILFRLPGADTPPYDGLQRSIEIAIYGLIIAVLVWVRAKFLESEDKRQELSSQRKQDQ